MSHITEFTIAGLTGRKDIYKQKLNRGINVFYGDNGSGKTSLLRILNSAMAGDSDEIKAVPFESAEVSIYSITYNRTFIRSIQRGTVAKKFPAKRKGVVVPPAREVTGEIGSMVFEYEEEDEQFVWKCKPSEPKDEAGTHWAHIYLPTWRLYVSDKPFIYPKEQISPRYVEREFDWDKFFGNKLEQLWSLYSNKLLSEVRKIQEEGLANILRGILKPERPTRAESKLDVGKIYKRVAAFLSRQKSPNVIGTLKSFSNRYTTEEAFRNMVNYINRIESQIEEAMDSRYQLGELIRKMFKGNKQIVFTDTDVRAVMDDGKDISLASLSSGEKHVLGIFIQTLLAESNTLLIDEPEISLHVDWQECLISSMQQLNPDAQLILATHSPGITANIEDDNIFSL